MYFLRCLRAKMTIFSYLSETAIFTAKRGDENLYFEPIRAKDYLSTPSVKAHSIHGEVVTIEPSEEDFKTHRSYQFQDLTTRGTIEFRSCLYPTFSHSTFAPGSLSPLVF